MSVPERANYLVIVNFNDNNGNMLLKPSRFLVYSALSSKHAINSVFSTGASHIPWDSNIKQISVVKDDSVSGVIKL